MNLVLGAYLTTIAFVCIGIAVARVARDAPLGAHTDPNTPR